MKKLKIRLKTEKSLIEEFGVHWQEISPFSLWYRTEASKNIYLHLGCYVYATWSEETGNTFVTLGDAVIKVVPDLIDGRINSTAIAKTSVMTPKQEPPKTIILSSRRKIINI